MNSQVTDVYTSALKLMAPLSAEATYATIVTEAQNLTRAAQGSIFLYKNEKLERVYSSVPKEQQLEPRKKGFTFQAFQKKETVVLTTAQIKEAHPEFSDDTTRSMIFISLSYENYSIGVITLDSTSSEPLTTQELEVLKLFGSLVSLKVRNMMLFAELKNTIETRDLFISMASHELKTPLTTISAYAQLIERNLASGKEIKPEWPTTLLSASNRMTRLINELLHVNKIRTGKMTYKYEPSDIAEILQQSLNDAKLSHPTKHIMMKDQRQDTALKIWADPDKLNQVFINLLTNAAKFTSDNKPIVIRLENHTKHITVSITDHGKGIAKPDLKHLFDEFYKADGNTQVGLGLGLFISKKIVAAHKGKIIIKSKVGVGTTVSITLPIISHV